MRSYCMVSGKRVTQPEFHFTRITLVAGLNVDRRSTERTPSRGSSYGAIKAIQGREDINSDQGSLLVVRSGRILEKSWNVKWYSHSGK